jgi:hypothetical protein
MTWLVSESDKFWRGGGKGSGHARLNDSISGSERDFYLISRSFLQTCMQDVVDTVEKSLQSIRWLLQVRNERFFRTKASTEGVGSFIGKITNHRHYLTSFRVCFHEIDLISMCLTHASCLWSTRQLLKTVVETILGVRFKSWMIFLSIFEGFWLKIVSCLAQLPTQNQRQEEATGCSFRWGIDNPPAIHDAQYQQSLWLIGKHAIASSRINFLTPAQPRLPKQTVSRVCPKESLLLCFAHEELECLAACAENKQCWASDLICGNVSWPFSLKNNLQCGEV